MQARADTTRDFFRALWPVDRLDGSLVIWTRDGLSGRKDSYWCKTLDEATELARQNRHDRDIYFGIALQDQERAIALTHRKNPSVSAAAVRGSSDSAVAIPGLWVDVDIRSPVHSATSLPTDVPEALSLLEAVPYEPTIIVNSGHGVHIYWLFHEPWVFGSEAERQKAGQLVTGVQAALRAEASARGWHLDFTADLARLLRVPGTLNHKESDEQSRAVTIERLEPDNRLDPTDLADHLPESLMGRTESARPRLQHLSDSPPADVDAILAGCPWMRHCFEDRRRLPEPEWYAALSILGRSSRGASAGRTLAHEWSKEHPGYSQEETDRKLDQALRAAGPRTCSNIAGELGAKDRYCKMCSHFGRITSPIVLGRGSSTRAEDPDAQRRRVLVGPDEKRVNDEALEALAGRPDLYTRGGLLVHILRDEGPEHRISRPKGAPRIVAVPNAVLREMLAESVDFRKVAGEGEQVPVSPPASCVRALAARGHWPPLRPLEAITQTPLLLPDGSVLQEPGYDRATGIYFLPKVKFPAVPDHPASTEVDSALALLRETVCDFPFAQERHRSAFLAAVLTILARHAFSGPAPLILVDANTRGSGKGLLADVAGRISTGQDVPRMAYSRDAEEQRKAILSLALEGCRVALIDNVAGGFGSATLDAALTATVWTDRILGASKTATVPLTIVWFATGNNIAVVGDTVRRCLYIRLESADEHPERRQGFRHPRLLDWVERNRGELTAAGLTLLRAYIAAGRPDQRLTSWGSFEGWSDLVRGCLVWLGLPDPGETRGDLYDSALDEDSTLRNLVAGLGEVFQELDGGCGTAREILRALQDKPESTFGALRDALADLFPRPAQNGLPSTAQLGAVLREYRGRGLGGRVLEHAGQGKTKRGRLWCVADLPGESGDGGDGDSPHLFSRRATPSQGDENGNSRGEGPSTASPASPLPTDGGLQRWQI